MYTKQLPGPLNDFLIVAGRRLVFTARPDGTAVGALFGRLSLGASLYFLVAGLYQKFVKKNRTP